MKVETQPLPPGDSREQRQAERLIVYTVASQIGVRAAPHKFALENGNWVTVDGLSEEPPVLIEAWAHIGSPKPAQKAKVMVDALKIHWIRSTLMKDARCVLAFADEAAAEHFVSPRTWRADCLRQLHIDVIVAVLPAGIRERLLQAQERQYC